LNPIVDVTRLWPLVYVAAGVVVGFFVERIFSFGLVRAAKRRWPAIAAGMDALSVAIFVWIVLIGIYATILSYDLKPETLDFVRKLLLAIALAAGTYVAGRGTLGFVATYTLGTGKVLPSASLLATFAELLVFVLGGMIVLNSVGISITPLLTALGVGGLAVGLSLSAPLSNLFAGLLIIASHQLRPGDYVKFDSGVEGWVVDITWYSTSLRDRSDNLIVMPNSKVTTSSFTNYDLPDPHLTLQLNGSLASGADLSAAEQQIAAAAADALRNCGVSSRTEPYVRFVDFTDSRINFAAFLSAESVDTEPALKNEFIKCLHARALQDPKALPLFS